ncbi:MAG: glycosyltransferase [Alphaproteobacteria bacterium]|nr:glycosyltransferase [Alphaproteobacteria bacterium]
MNSKIQENVAVLLCLFQGKEFIEEQVDSIINQSHKNISLWVSIDGADDGSKDLIEKRTQGWQDGKVRFLSGPGKGFAENFLSLLCNEDIKADYYSFSDQDDIWERDKLSRALDYLKSVPPDVPAIYGSRTTLINKFGKKLGESKFFKKKPSFENALVQNIAAGNTMVLNKAARSLIKKHFKNNKLFFHDWLSYLVVSAVGGNVFHDSYTSLQYRQHGENLMGENASLLSRFYRLKLLINGTFREWNEINVGCLEKISDMMTEKNKKRFHHFKNSRNKSMIQRIFGFWKAGVYRQTFLENVFLFIAFILKRI